MMASVFVGNFGIKALSRASSLAMSKRLLSNDKRRGRFNVGVIGAGRIGKLHIENILSTRKLALNWIVEDNEKAWPDVKEKFQLQDTPFYVSDQLPSLLSEKSLDAVFIFSPIPLHTQQSCQALQQGKAVFVEKPAGETIKDIEKCFLAAESNNVPFLVGFNRRFDPTMAEIHRKVTTGTVGKLQYLRFTSRDSPKPSYDFLKSCDNTGCNILSDMCVHDVDQLVWLTQSERPEHVYVTTHAHDAVMAEYGVADAIGMIVKYKSGAIASFDGFRESVYGYDIRLEVFGSRGMVLAQNPRETSACVDSVDGGHVNRLYLSFPQRFEVAFRAELDHFVKCLEGQDKPLVTKQEGLMVAEIIDKGLESFRQKAPVYF